MKITKENILKLLEERDIFQYYFPQKIDLRKNKYRNPFRIDNNTGSCHFNYYKGKFYFFDKSTDDSFDVFTYVGKLYNLNFFQVLHKINYDFNLNLQSNNTITNFIKNNVEETVINSSFLNSEKDCYSNNGSSEFRIITRKFTKTDLNYWNSFNINEFLLNTFNVKAVDKYYSIDSIGRQRLIYDYKSDKKDLCYCFEIKSYNLKKVYYKIYRPYQDKKNKWASKCPSYFSHGFEQLSNFSDIVLITKSLKDVMCLRSLGYDAISPMSESSLLKPFIVNTLKMRYQKVIIFFDNDIAGIKFSDLYCSEYTLQSIKIPLSLYPNIKDISDMTKEKSVEEAKQFLKNTISSL